MKIFHCNIYQTIEAILCVRNSISYSIITCFLNYNYDYEIRLEASLLSPTHYIMFNSPIKPLYSITFTPYCHYITILMSNNSPIKQWTILQAAVPPLLIYNTFQSHYFSTQYLTNQSIKQKESHYPIMPQLSVSLYSQIH